MNKRGDIPRCIGNCNGESYNSLPTMERKKQQSMAAVNKA